MVKLIHVAVALILTFLLASCGSLASTGGSSSGGGASGSTGGTVSGGTTGAPVAPTGGASAAGDYPHTGGDTSDSGTTTSDAADGCTIFFGRTKDGSGEYLVSASSEGIGGQVSWSCASVSSVDRFDLHVTLQYALVATGPWTDDDHPNATVVKYGIDNRGSSVFPFNTGCTTDWWRVKASWTIYEAGGGSVVRAPINSQARKVTDEDCNRG